LAKAGEDCHVEMYMSQSIVPVHLFQKVLSCTPYTQYYHILDYSTREAGKEEGKKSHRRRNVDIKKKVVCKEKDVIKEKDRDSRRRKR
jgi:hypothetical protein